MATSRVAPQVGQHERRRAPGGRDRRPETDSRRRDVAQPSEAAAIPRHQVTLLGGFGLAVDGDLVAVPTSTQRIISLLALRGRVGRSRLAGSLWGDTTEIRALGSLRTALWRANQAAPGLVEAGQDSLSLTPGVDVDVTRLVQTGHDIMEGRCLVPLDSPGLQYLEGDLLPDWTDEWLVVDRERLRQLRLHVLETLAAGLAERGMFGMAMEAGLMALRADVLRESAHRVVIRIHLAEGNVAEALHAFQECVAVLNREVGVPPSPETVRLLQGIRERGIRERGIGERGRAATGHALVGGTRDDGVTRA
jgi:DNA-binding SARP family transcriptional activator